MNDYRTLRSPVSVNLEVTPVCNLMCEFCYKESNSTLKHPELNTIFQIVDELHKAEVFEVRLFGGEFFSYPHWHEVLQYIHRKGFFISFVSNGTYITPEIATELVKCGVNGGGISIHGIKEVHDQITKVEGSYQSAVSGLISCLDAGIVVSVLTTLTRTNMDHLPDLLIDLQKRGLLNDPSRINFGVNRLTPYGRGGNEWQNKKLTLKDYIAVFKKLEVISSEFGISTFFADSFPACLIPEQLQYLIASCTQGVSFGYICSNGDVKGCAICSGSYGNLLQSPLEHIWQNDLLKKYRQLEWLPKKCRTCDTFCGGGCSASISSNEFYGRDEFMLKG